MANPREQPAPAPDSFQKRLKRHVIGRVRDYFAVAAPGLEKWCLKELRSIGLSVNEMRPVAGGVAFKGRLADCYAANLHLRTAGRILMRVGRFKATGFSRLAQQLDRIQWELFLADGQPPDVRVAVRHCRLHHTGAVTDRVEAAIARHLQDGLPLPAGTTAGTGSQRVYVRGLDDRFTVSLDSSGDNLYKRGIKVRGGTAPLRETLAAAVLLTAGYRPGEPLIDPMCGAGTFSLEAAMRSLNIPAGWHRSFAFEAWPSFQARRWQFMRRACEKQFAKIRDPRIFASDRSRQACDRLSKIVGGCGYSGAVTVAEKDFFSLSPSAVARPPGLVVINPPYGRRLKTAGGGRELLARIDRRLTSAYRGWKFALLTTDRRAARQILRPHRAVDLAHGGLKLTLIFGRIA